MTIKVKFKKGDKKLIGTIIDKVRTYDGSCNIDSYVIVDDDEKHTSLIHMI